MLIKLQYYTTCSGSNYKQVHTCTVVRSAGFASQKSPCVFSVGVIYFFEPPRDPSQPASNGAIRLSSRLVQLTCSCYNTYLYKSFFKQEAKRYSTLSLSSAQLLNWWDLYRGLFCLSSCNNTIQYNTIHKQEEDLFQRSLLQLIGSDLWSTVNSVQANSN